MNQVRLELPTPAAEQLGRADRQMPDLTVVVVAGKGKGVCKGFKRNVFGPNDHQIEFEHGLEVVKLRNERWHALVVDQPAGTGPNHSYISCDRPLLCSNYFQSGTESASVEPL